MYRCNECQREYLKKVEYCDCGNNTFEYIKDTLPSSPKEPITMEQRAHMISLAFLIICIVLSMIVWMIPVKTTTKEVKPQEEKMLQPLIPDIDKIWDNTPTKIVEKIQKQEIDKSEPIKLNVIPYDNEINSKNNQFKKQNNVSHVSKPIQKTKTENKNLNDNIKLTNTNNKTINTNKPIHTEQKKTHNKQINKQEQVQKPQQEIKLSETPKQSYNPNSQEMLKYKGELRAVLFRNLPVGSITGSGNCSVHFSIDSSGKLINRGFTKLSDNKSLNDAVYYMLMSVPKYKTPPSSYSGEMINMGFTMNNGNYEITIQ